MADYVNPVTQQLVASADSMPPPWVACTRANFNAWQAIPSQYRKWVVNHIEEMTAQEKATVDAAALAAQRDAQVAQLDHLEGVQRAFMLTVLERLNSQARQINALLRAIDTTSKDADVKAELAKIEESPQLTALDLKTAVREKLGT